MTDVSNKQITRWGKVHGWWLHHPMTDADHLCILAALSTYADDRGFCHPSQATLARHVKRSRPWVNRVIAELTEHGLIQKTARTRTTNAGTTSCEYRLMEQCEGHGRDERPVPTMTPPGHNADTPRQAGDTSQLTTKHNKYPRPPGASARGDHASKDDGRARWADRVTVPTDWAPSDAASAKARSLCPETDLEAHAAMFVARCRSKGYLYVADGMDDAWLSWLAEDRLKGATRIAGQQATRQGRGVREAGDRRFAAWAAAATAPRMGKVQASKPTNDNPWN